MPRNDIDRQNPCFAEEDEGRERLNLFEKLSAPGLITYVFTVTFSAVDWAESLRALVLERNSKDRNAERAQSLPGDEQESPNRSLVAADVITPPRIR